MPANGIDLINAVITAAEVFLRESQRLFRPLGLTAAQYNVLNVLSSRAGGLSQRELSDALVVDRSNVTGMVDRMEKAGWLKRADDPADRRVYRVSLTPGGRALWAKAAPLYAAAAEEVSHGLKRAERETALAVLKAVTEAAPRWSQSKNSQLHR